MIDNVAFLTINYNSTEDTIELIESFQEPSINLVVYVLDNGSNELEYRYLKKYVENLAAKKRPAVKLFRSDVNLGFSRGNNFLREKARDDFDYYIIGNNDLVMTSNAITRIVAEAKDCSSDVFTSTIAYYDKEDIIWYGGGRESFEPRFRPRHLNKGKSLSEVIDRPNKVVTFASGAWMVIKKDLLNRNYLFDENMFFGEEDAEFCRRITAYGSTIKYIPSVIIYHKVGESQNSRKRTELNRYHVQSKIYNLSKSYSPFFSLPYLPFFFFYQVFLAFKEQKFSQDFLNVVIDIPLFYLKGLLNRRKE